MFRGHRAWFSQSWPAAGRSPTGGTPTTSSAATLPTRTPAEYTRASITWRTELQSFTPVTSLSGRAPVRGRSRQCFWATSSCHPPACKKVEGKKSSGFGSPGGSPVSAGFWGCKQEPPEIRRKIGSFIWEQAGDSLAEQPNENLTDELEVVRKGCEEEAEEDVLDLAESSEEETDSRAPAQGKFPYRALQEYPMNNMVTGYTAARDMKKYVGELRDFIPGTSGYTAYWIQNEINIYSDVKTKMKRKF